MADNATPHPHQHTLIPPFLTVLMVAPQQRINAIEICLHAILTLRGTRTHTKIEWQRGKLEKAGKWKRTNSTHFAQFMTLF